MVTTCHAAWYPGATGETVHSSSDSWTQMKLQEDAALQVLSYRECLEPLDETGSHGFLACRRCAVVKELCYQVKELQAKWQDRPMGWERDQLNVLWDPTASRAWVFSCSRETRACPREVGKWKLYHDKMGKLMTSHTRRNAPALPEGLQLQNKFSVLIAVSVIKWNIFGSWAWSTQDH